MCAWPAVCARGRVLEAVTPVWRSLTFSVFALSPAEQQREESWLGRLGRGKEEAHVEKVCIAIVEQVREAEYQKCRSEVREEMWTHKRDKKKGEENKITGRCCACEPHVFAPHTCFFDIYLYWCSNGNEEDGDGTGRQRCVCRPR